MFKSVWFPLALVAVIIITIVALNAYVLDFTHGYYNMFDVMLG